MPMAHAGSAATSRAHCLCSHCQFWRIGSGRRAQPHRSIGLFWLLLGGDGARPRVYAPRAPGLTPQGTHSMRSRRSAAAAPCVSRARHACAPSHQRPAVQFVGLVIQVHAARRRRGRGSRRPAGGRVCGLEWRSRPGEGQCEPRICCVHRASARHSTRDGMVRNSSSYP